MWRPDINVADSFFSKILPYIYTKMALRAWKPSKGVAALGKKHRKLWINTAYSGIRGVAS